MVFRDNFESGLLEQWQISRGSVTQWQIQAGALVGTVLSQSSISEIIPVETAWSKRWGNYRFTVDIKPMRGSDRNVAWNYQDPRNWYEAHFVGNLVQLYRLREGVTGYISSHQYFLTPFEWHRIQVEVRGQRMQLWVDNWLVADVQDWFDDGRVGSIALKVGTGAVAPSEVWFDNVQVELLTTEQDIQLAVPEFRQDDDAWAADEYDQAGDWSNSPSIKRWGCALSSIAMVLRHFGFSFLPSGVEINPGTLNQWLQTQPDGYIAEGWVNWLAIERLTRLMVRDYVPGFQALRIQQLAGNNFEQLFSRVVSELQSARPVILALPGHFVVATGTLSDQQELRIIDPGYESKTVGQHEMAGRPIQSLRLIEPYALSEAPQLQWLVVIKGVAQPHLLASDGSDFEWEWRQWLGPEKGLSVEQHDTDMPEQDDHSLAATEWQVWQASLPPSGEYLLSLDDADQVEEIRWYAYGLNDAVTMRLFTAEMLTKPILVVTNENMITQWPEHAAQAWHWLVRWWEENESVVQPQDLEGWLRIRYLLRLVVKQAVFDQRQVKLLLTTIAYYQQAAPSDLLLELESKLQLVLENTQKL